MTQYHYDTTGNITRFFSICLRRRQRYGAGLESWVDERIEKGLSLPADLLAATCSNPQPLSEEGQVVLC